MTNSMDQEMPNRTDKMLLILGLLSYLAGQIWIVTSGSMTKDQIAFDAIHWLMFVGAALIIPFAARMPRRGIALVAGPLLLVGCILIIGMCMIDFVLWSFTEPDMRNAVIGELMATPPVWGPFIEWAGRTFTLALGILGLCFWRTSLIGTALVLIGAVVIGAWGIGSNPYGYSIIIAGLLVCFWAERKTSDTFTSAE